MNAASIPFRFRTQAQGWIIAGAGVGGALAPILFTHMISAIGWRAAFLWTGATIAFIGGFWHFVTRNTAGSASETIVVSIPAQWLRVLCNRNLVLLTLGYSALGYFEYLFFYWAFYYFGEVRHMGAKQSTLYTTYLWIAFGVMSPLGGFASDRVTAHWGRRVGRRIVPICALTLSTGLLLAAMNMYDAEHAGTTIAAAIGFAAFTEASFWAAMIELSGEHTSTADGILNTGSNVGGFTGLLLTPWLASRFGWTIGIYVGCTIAALSILVWPFIDTTRMLPQDAGCLKPDVPFSQ